ncbi:Methionine aminotransferase [Glycine soja]|uniref:Methionine aminotransferase n=1 Tax=Glycine soja TaxID=3848 RepID=A0A445FLZ7_GLYSO|nr:Methionine aminotransferase [Glycine soja]
MSTFSTKNDTVIHKTQQPLQIAKRLEKFQTTIFTQMRLLAIKHGAINLGQGFPNFDGPKFVKEAAIQAIRDGKNQYAQGYGVADLNIAIANRFKKDTGLVVDPEKDSDNELLGEDILLNRMEDWLGHSTPTLITGTATGTRLPHFHNCPSFSVCCCSSSESTRLLLCRAEEELYGKESYFG